LKKKVDFEEHLALYLSYFEFPEHKNDLYQPAGSEEQDFKRFARQFKVAPPLYDVITIYKIID
jgi:hypothetical protein